MTLYKDNVYKITIPKDHDMCIFSSNGGNQTADLDVPGNGYISDAQIGVMPANKPPSGKPPEPSKRLPRVRSRFIRRLTLSVKEYRLFSRELFPSVNNHIYIARIQFHCVANPAVLLTRYNRCAAAAEQVEDNVLFLRVVADLIIKELDRLR